MKVVLASRAFELKRRNFEKYPMVLDEAGEVVLAIDDYLFHGATRRNVAIGTLKDEAYILSSWWEWANSPARRASLISTDLLTEWHGQQLQLAKLRPGEKGVKGRARIDRCLEVIQAFNRFLLRRYPAPPILKSQTKIASYLLRLDRVELGDQANDIRYATRPERKGPGRPTPSYPEVEAVLEALSGAPDPLLAERNYLLALWMSEAGLRAGGVSSLTTSAVTKGLREIGLPSDESVEDAERVPSLQVRLHQFLQSQTQLGRTVMPIDVIEKGPVKRTAMAGLGLVDATLRLVWAVPPAMPNMSTAIFRSRKTGEALNAGSIGDIVASAFKSSGVRGSGHRLRAAYAERVVFELCEQAYARQGLMFDERMVLFDAAEMLGQSNYKSLRSYLNNARRNLTLLKEAHERRAGGACPNDL